MTLEMMKRSYILWAGFTVADSSFSTVSCQLTGSVNGDVPSTRSEVEARCAEVTTVISS